MADPGLNKGTAFTDEERATFGLVGLLPDSVETLEQQLARTEFEFERLDNDLERHVFLRSLEDQNEVLFYHFVLTHLDTTLPIVFS